MSDDSFLKKLKGFTPESSGLDRDLLMFAAGQASARVERCGDERKRPNVDQVTLKAASCRRGELPAVDAALAMADAGRPICNGNISETDAITLIREVKILAVKARGCEKLTELVKALAK
jgi:hypothetical protein